MIIQLEPMEVAEMPCSCCGETVCEFFWRISSDDDTCEQDGMRRASGIDGPIIICCTCHEIANGPLCLQDEVLSFLKRLNALRQDPYRREHYFDEEMRELEEWDARRKLNANKTPDEHSNSPGV